MKHLIKRYHYFLSEQLHWRINFKKSLSGFHFLSNLSQQHIFPKSAEYYKNQLNENFCWFFFASPSIKKQHTKKKKKI